MIAFVLGHDITSQGAYSPYLDLTEYQYNKEVIKRLDWLGFDTFKHTPGFSYRRKMQNTYRQLNAYNLTVELHFNSFTDTRASGTEVLYFAGNKDGKNIANHLCNHICKEYHTINRGAKPLSNSSQRGFYAVASGIPTALIVEPFFGSHPESQRFLDPHQYADLLAECLELY